MYLSYRSLTRTHDVVRSLVKPLFKMSEKSLSQAGLKKIKEIDGHYALREPEATYNVSFDHEDELLSSGNRFYLDLNT